MQLLFKGITNYTLRIETNKRIPLGNLVVAVIALVGATTAAATIIPAGQQIVPSAYAATATGGSAITEDACSTGSFADNFLASVSSSCGPNSSTSAGGDVALGWVMAAGYQLESKAHAQLVIKNDNDNKTE